MYYKKYYIHIKLCIDNNDIIINIQNTHIKPIEQKKMNKERNKLTAINTLIIINYILFTSYFIQYIYN